MSDRCKRHRSRLVKACRIIGWKSLLVITPRDLDRPGARDQDFSSESLALNEAVNEWGLLREGLSCKSCRLEPCLSPCPHVPRESSLICFYLIQKNLPPLGHQWPAALWHLGACWTLAGLCSVGKRAFLSFCFITYKSFPDSDVFLFLHCGNSK